MRNEAARITDDGQLILSDDVRRQLGWGPEDRLLVSVSNGELKVRALAPNLRRAQDIVMRNVPEGVSLVDELIRERRFGTPASD